MAHHLRHLPAVLADLSPDVRSVGLAFGLSIVLLLAALTWSGLSLSSPVRAAEAAVREGLAAPDAEIESRLHFRPDLPPYRAGSVLVCGRIGGARPYAALVQKRRRRGAASLLGSPDRVFDLAIGGSPRLAERQSSLLAACAARD
ncbi:hypothetical protein [Brevundimonas sp.]|uniref:hypothetical protein n=1 Tax=Brevundimonas sp. TaxID=1871086 RepID=UPI0035AEE7E4